MSRVSTFNDSKEDWSRNTVGARQVCLLSPTLLNSFLERVMCEALGNHKSIVSYQRSAYHQLLFCRAVVVNAEKREADVLVYRLEYTTTRHMLETCTDKVKVMTYGFLRQIKINGQRIESFEKDQSSLTKDTYWNEPRHDKANKMNVRPAKTQISLGIRPVWSVFTVRMKKAWVLSYPLSAQRRLWPDWADAQADLSLRWAHTHFVGFVMSWLIFFLSRTVESLASLSTLKII